MRERFKFLQNACCSVRKNLIPVLGYLEMVGIQRSKIGFKLEGTMSTLVAYLVSIGFNARDIGPMVTQYPYFLGMRVSSWTTVEDVAKMIVKCPQLFALQVGLMKTSFYFFKSEMGRPLKELVEFPEYFSYGLESRIKPRYQRLQHKGIRSSLSWFLNCSDQRFEERLYADYIETEVQGPWFVMGGKLDLPGNQMVSNQMVSDDEDESDDEILYRRTVSDRDHIHISIL
ncbi:putative transcription regulator mTERF family [Helianthus debilis subsp. tardiflorus]